MGADAVALDEIVAAARLSGGAGRKKSFTVAQLEAVLALRRRPAERWAFCVPLLRAALCLSRAAVATVTASPEGRVSFRFVVPDVDWEDLDVGGLLSASLEPDRGTDPAADAWRRLMGRAVNGALGQDPRTVELSTPRGGRRWDRAEARPDEDPYAERLRSDELGPQTIGLDVVLPERSFVQKLWKSSHPVDDIARLWSRALGRPIAGLDDGVRLLPEGGVEPVDLGGFATYYPDPTAPGLFLERNGVLVAPLRGAGLEDPPRGRVDCPALALDVDETSVVADAQLDLLAAWLHADAVDDDIDLEPYIGGPPGEAEVLYRWPHHPAEAGVPVLPVTPPVLARLQQEHPEVDFVPFAQFRDVAAARRADFTALAQGSIGPVAVAVDPVEGVPLEVRVYVHRYPAATQGVVQVLAWRRTVLRVDDPGQGIPGATIVASLRGDRQGEVDLGAVVAHVVAAVGAATDTLVGAAVAKAGPDAVAVPVVKRALDALDGAALGLHFDRDLRLSWIDSPLLQLSVGHERDGTPRTLGDALVRVRDVGGVVHGDELKRWYTLESDEPQLSAWILSDRGRALLHRVLGPLLLWEMPIVPEAQPRPLPAGSQPQLVLGADEIRRKLDDRVTDGRAVEHLLGHALVTRIAGGDAMGLDLVPLLRRYDPRALTPRRRVSLATVLADGTKRVAPSGAVGRWLDAPTLEVTPAIAALLGEAITAEPAEPPSTAVASESSPPRRQPSAASARRPDAAAVLVRTPIAHPLCAGALHFVEGPHDGIELWAKGLRVGAFRLPSPLRELGGRLWLTDAGIEAGHAGIVKLCLDAGRELVVQALAALSLSPPQSHRHAALEAFVDSVRAHIRAAGDRLQLADVVGIEPRPEPASFAPLRQLPPPRERLLSIVRYVLGVPIRFDTAWLSWRAVKVVDDTPPGRLELGLRHPLVSKALRDDADITDLWPAALTIVAGAPSFANKDAALIRLLSSIGSLG